MKGNFRVDLAFWLTEMLAVELDINIHVLQPEQDPLRSVTV
jgi:hypothetical protein